MPLPASPACAHMLFIDLLVFDPESQSGAPGASRYSQFPFPSALPLPQRAAVKPFPNAAPCVPYALPDLQDRYTEVISWWPETFLAPPYVFPQPPVFAMLSQRVGDGVANILAIGHITRKMEIPNQNQNADSLANSRHINMKRDGRPQTRKLDKS